MQVYLIKMFSKHDTKRGLRKGILFVTRQYEHETKSKISLGFITAFIYIEKS